MRDERRPCFLSSLIPHPSEDEPCYLGPAVEPQRALAPKAGADVKNRRRLFKDATVEAPAIQAGHEDRSEQGQPDLPAVVVARQHQIDVVSLGPADVVGGMAQTQAKG